jgi:hypothetical protein
MYNSFYPARHPTPPLRGGTAPCQGHTAAPSSALLSAHPLSSLPLGCRRAKPKRCDGDGGSPRPPMAGTAVPHLLHHEQCATRRWHPGLLRRLPRWQGLGQAFGLGCAAAPSTAVSGGTLGSSHITRKPGVIALGIMVVISSFTGGG